LPNNRGPVRTPNPKVDLASGEFDRRKANGLQQPGFRAVAPLSERSSASRPLASRINLPVNTLGPSHAKIKKSKAKEPLVIRRIERSQFFFDTSKIHLIEAEIL